MTTLEVFDQNGTVLTLTITETARQGHNARIRPWDDRETALVVPATRQYTAVCAAKTITPASPSYESNGSGRGGSSIESATIGFRCANGRLYSRVRARAGISDANRHECALASKARRCPDGPALLRRRSTPPADPLAVDREFVDNFVSVWSSRKSKEAVDLFRCPRMRLSTVNADKVRQRAHAGIVAPGFPARHVLS